MKKIQLFVLCMLAICSPFAQSKFGIISYTLPEGWYARESGNDIEIVKKVLKTEVAKLPCFNR